MSETSLGVMTYYRHDTAITQATFDSHAAQPKFLQRYLHAIVIWLPTQSRLVLIAAQLEKVTSLGMVTCLVFRVLLF